MEDITTVMKGQEVVGTQTRTVERILMGPGPSNPYPEVIEAFTGR